MAETDESTEAVVEEAIEAANEEITKAVANAEAVVEEAVEAATSKVSTEAVTVGSNIRSKH